MKNRMIAKKSFAYAARDFLRKINVQIDMDELHKDASSITHGALWGVSLVALMLGIAGMKNYVTYNKMLKETQELINTFEYGDVDSIGSELESGIAANISNLLDEYMCDYISSNDISQFFTDETKASITTTVESQILEKLKSETTLTSNQEKLIRELISEKISKIDYSSIEQSIKNQILQYGQINNANIESLTQKLTNELTLKFESQISSVLNEIADKAQISNAAVASLRQDHEAKINELSKTSNEKIDALSSSTTAAMIALSQSLTKDMNDRYQKLLDEIMLTNSRISDPNNHEYFQYGFETESGAAGYYINNQFKPF